jgi:hypothetical protein
MIIGVTHDHDGRVVQRLSVSTKVSIGLPPNGDCNHPTKLDHFVFLRKKKTANRVEWEVDPELTAQYGEQCRELRIILIDDDIENIFPSSYAWWTATERKCWGDGASATRRTADKPAGEPWQCGNGCPELAAGQCKPSGDLRFVLADFPRLGSVCRIHTSSYRSIRQIHSALQEIQTFTGGRLAGITGKLVVRPEEVAYFDRKEKRKKTASIWALSLEVEGDDMRKLIANLTENARLFAETRKLLAGGKVLEVVEDEQEQAPELTAEFYPANGSSSTESAEASRAPVSPPLSASPKPPPESPSPPSNSASNGGNGSGKSPANGAPSAHASNNGNNPNGSRARSGFNQLRNEFLAAARRVATSQKRTIGEVVEWASGGAFKYGDIGRMIEADTPRLLAATELMVSSLPGAAR